MKRINNEVVINKDNRKCGYFECPFCEEIVVRIIGNGLRAKSCGCVKKSKTVFIGLEKIALDNNMCLNTLRRRMLNGKTLEEALAYKREYKTISGDGLHVFLHERTLRQKTPLFHGCLAHLKKNSITLKRLTECWEEHPEQELPYLVEEKIEWHKENSGLTENEFAQKYFKTFSRVFVLTIKHLDCYCKETGVDYETLIFGEMEDFQQCIRNSKSI